MEIAFAGKQANGLNVVNGEKNRVRIASLV